MAIHTTGGEANVAQPERAENRRITVVVLAERSALPSDVSFKF